MKGLGLVLDLPVPGMGPGLAPVLPPKENPIFEPEFAVNSICWLSNRATLC